jgi:hypothetical protein
MKLMLTLFLGSFVLAAGYAAVVTIHIVRQRRAERTLASQLAEDTTFHEILAQYAEQIYQFGQPCPESAGRLWSHVLQRASGLRPHGYFIAKALTRPSLIDRHRYLGKVVQQALRSTLKIPFAELELAAVDAPGLAN